MTREMALKIINEKLTNKNLVKHSLAVEAVMKALARKFNEDEDIWGMAGLLHDLDYEITADDWTKHGIVTEEWLKDYNLPDEIFKLIRAHNAEALGIKCEDRGEWAIFAVDPVTGFITAGALVTPDKKLADVKISSLLKKFKNVGFARGANRNNIASCEKIGLTLEEFLEIALSAMQGISQDLAL